MAGSALDPLGNAMPRSNSHPQLTIFYSGTVNVYNNVPADKAHAIMLLLNSNNGGPKPGLEAAAASSRDNSDKAFVAGTASQANVGSMLKSPTPPQSPFNMAQMEKKPQLVCKRSQAELPFARKASLARFLEKRKDRVQVQAKPSEGEVSGEVSKKAKLSVESSDQ